MCEANGNDESPIEGVRPAVVVFPADVDEVSAVLAFAARERISVTPRGAGTGKVGGAIPVSGGIVLSLSAMDRILEVDTAKRLARVEPGVATGVLRDEVASRGLYYPPNPNSLDECSIGGNVATNAAGPCSMKYGATRAHVAALEVVLADGTQMTLGRKTTKCSTGYDLSGLVVGSEGTLAVVTAAILRLRVAPGATRTLFGTFDSTRSAIEGLAELYRAGIVPAAAEFFDQHALEAVERVLAVPEGARAALLFQLDGTEPTIDREMSRLGDTLSGFALDLAAAKDERQARRFWDARKEVSIWIKEKFACRSSEDIAVPPPCLPEMVSFLETLRGASGVRIVSYGHAGDGNLHVNFLYQHAEQQPMVEGLIERLFRKTLALDGTLSGEHGIGLTKQRFMGLEQSNALMELQKRLKSAWDPQNILNPGKVFP